MRKNFAVALALLLITVSLTGCSSDQESTQKQVAEVQRGNLIISITADGNLEMPREAKLRFGTPGTVKEIKVNEGDRVRVGTLLVKLDDTAHKLAIAAAQYDVELAINELAERIYPAVMDYPKHNPTLSALLRLEQAQEELAQAEGLMEQGDYKEAVASLRIAEHDLEASYEVLSLSITDELAYSDILRATNRLEQNREEVGTIRELIAQGNYEHAATALNTAQSNLEETHRTIKRSFRLIISFIPSYPDTSTSLDCLVQVEEQLRQIQELIEQDDYDEVKVAELLRIVQHDLEMSHQILESNELFFKHGINLKLLRKYNLNLQKAEIALQNTKEDLMKTEILAPFDGAIVDIGVKETDQLSAYDYSSITAVHIVDTSAVEMNGVVDEIDVFKVKVGQEAIITVDALPDVEIAGEVIFISPFGTETTGVVEFAVTLALAPSDLELRGGLTTTADIIIEKHENVLQIPNRAIKGTPGDYWVEVVIDETTEEVETRQVTLGAQDKKFTEVTSGLKEGEKVIVEAVRQSSGLF